MALLFVLLDSWGSSMRLVDADRSLHACMRMVWCLIEEDLRRIKQVTTRTRTGLIMIA